MSRARPSCRPVLGPTAFGLALLLLLSRPVRADEDHAWTGAFSSGLGFFVGGGVGGGFARHKRTDDLKDRWIVSLPLTLRAGFDIGRYGLAVLLDTQYVFMWGPAAWQGPRPESREGELALLSITGNLLWRPVHPMYLSFGAGAALTTRGQTIIADPVTARAEIVSALGFIYRFSKKDAPKDDESAHYPAGLTVSLESRFYVAPEVRDGKLHSWNERFLSFSIQAVLTVYLVFNVR